MNGSKISVVSALALALITSAGTTCVEAATMPPVSEKQNVTYVTDIKPLFEKSCVGCHGAKNAKGKLRLDSREATLAGGEDGKVVASGDSANSVLVRAVAGLSKKAMPPKPKEKDMGKYKPVPLTLDQIGLLRAWIDQGAK